MSQQILPGVLGEAGPVSSVRSSFADRDEFEIEAMIPWVGHAPGTWREKRTRPLAKLYYFDVDDAWVERRTGQTMLMARLSSLPWRFMLKLSGANVLDADAWKGRAVACAGRIGLHVNVSQFSGTAIFADELGQVLLVCLSASHPEFGDAVLAGVALAAAGADPGSDEQIVDRKTGELLRVEHGAAFTLAVDAALEAGQPWAPALARLVRGRPAHDPLIRSLGIAGRQLAARLDQPASQGL